MCRAKVCPLAEIGFSEENCPSVAKLAGDECIPRCDRSLECERTGSSCHSVAGFDVVLQENWNSVQRTARSTRRALAIKCVCNRERLGIRLENVMKSRSSLVERIDSVEVLLRNRSSGTPPLGHVALKLNYCCFLEIEHRVVSRSGLVAPDWV